MSQAVAAVEAQGGDSDGSDWDDHGYPLGAVALPIARGPEQRPVPEMAAAGTKAGAEKARATRESKRNAQAPMAPTLVMAQVPAAVPGVGTQQIASPADAAGLEALKSRRDKAAAKERRSRLPDHGRNIVPQGLNRLPKSFLVGVSPGQDQQGGLGQQVGGAHSQTGPAAVPGPVPVPGGRQPDGNPQGTRVVLNPRASGQRDRRAAGRGGPFCQRGPGPIRRGYPQRPGVSRVGAAGRVGPPRRGGNGAGRQRRTRRGAPRSVACRGGCHGIEPGPSDAAITGCKEGPSSPRQGGGGCSCCNIQQQAGGCSRPLPCEPPGPDGCRGYLQGGVRHSARRGGYPCGAV
jgi:hypothetical protein